MAPLAASEDKLALEAALAREQATRHFSKTNQIPKSSSQLLYQEFF